LASHGARVARFDDDLVAFYTSGQGAKLFDWADASRLAARRLADLFVQRFPRIADGSVGADPDYLRWFDQVLALAERDFLPITFADWPLEEGEWLPLVGGGGGEPPARLPMPPPGKGPDV
jgi:hypothetical protein